MFEYTTVTGIKVSINPRYITSISTNHCNDGQCCISTVDSSWIVKEHYDTVKKHFGNFLIRG